MNDQHSKGSMLKPEPNNKTLPTRLPQWRDNRKNHNIQGDMRTLLGKECEVEKMRSLKGLGKIDWI